MILDADLARVYEVPTKRLNEQVRRNPGRFPEEFAFQLNAREARNLRSQIATSSPGYGGARHRPFAFTEHGAVMAASVLNSRKAVAASIVVVRTFVRLAHALARDPELALRFAKVEETVAGHDGEIADIQLILREMNAARRRRERIGFHPRRRRHDVSANARR